MKPVSNSPSTARRSAAVNAAPGRRARRCRGSARCPLVAWSRRRVAVEGVVDRHHGRQLAPSVTGNVSRSSAAIAAGSHDDHRDRLAPEPDLVLREHGLVGRRRDHAERLRPGDVGSRQHRHDPRRAPRRTRRGRRTGSPARCHGRAHDADHERSSGDRRRRRRRCRAPSRSPSTRCTRLPHGLADGGRRHRRRPSTAGAHHGRRRSCGSRCSGRARPRARPSPGASEGLGRHAQQGGRRHQHARRADAALRARRAAGTPAAAAAISADASSPSRVSTCRPWRRPRGIMQALTGSPSSNTVHAPQSPASHPTFVPVRPRSSRTTSLSRRDGPGRLDRIRSPGTSPCSRGRSSDVQAASARRTRVSAASRR